MSMTETDEEFLARMMFGFPLKPGTYEIGTASLDRLINLALRGLTAREAALEEAAKVADDKRAEYEEACAVECEEGNDEYSMRMGDKSDVCVELATAIRALGQTKKGKK
jgi:hypothetical protein